MEATNIIRDAVARVALLRQTASDTPGLARAVSKVKHFQAMKPHAMSRRGGPLIGARTEITQLLGQTR